jgi:hypothetical protein
MALANYYAVFDRASAGQGFVGDERKFKAGKILGAISPVEVARVVKLEAETVKEAQEIVREAYPDLSSGTPVIITEAAYKES